MGSEFQIITYPNRTFCWPRVAWNHWHNKYLVVWYALDATTLQVTDVATRVLAGDGTDLGGYIISSDMWPQMPDVTYNVTADEYLVVWRRMWTDADGAVVAARISGNTNLVIDPPGLIQISAPTINQTRPTVATNHKDRYVVAWQQVSSTAPYDWDVAFRALDNNGAEVGGVVVLPEYPSSADDTAPMVAVRSGSGSDVAIAYQRTLGTDTTRETVWFYRQWIEGATASDEFGPMANWSVSDSMYPTVAWGAPGYVVAFESAGPVPLPTNHIWAMRYVPHAVFIPLVLRSS